MVENVNKLKLINLNSRSMTHNTSNTECCTAHHSKE